MRHTIFAFLGLCLITASTSAQSRPQVQPIDPQPFGAPVVERLQLDILPAFTHKNLTVLLLQGEERIPGAKYLTLSEALQQRKVIVHETQTVHSLTVENISGRDLVIIQAGDIVKGGKQDRVIPYDVIVPPGSGKMPLPSFCVEAHRWKKRGDESDKQFSSSTDVLHSNALKLAARYHRSQREVWNRARSTQRQLSRTLNHDVTATRSVSSLQLTLEHRTVVSGVNEYLKVLPASLKHFPGVIGVAFAINGKVQSAEIYASHALLKKVWKKLAKAAAVEAIAQREKHLRWAPVTEAQIRAFLADADEGKSARRDVTRRTKQVLQEGPTAVLFETRDRALNHIMIRRSYIAK